MTDNNQVDSALLSFLWAYQINGQGQGTSIEADKINVATSTDNLLWVHIRSDGIDAPQQLSDFGVPKRIIDTLTADETRPKTTQSDDGVVTFLRGINRNPNADPEDMVSLRVWMTDKVVITARKKDRRLQSIVELKQSLIAGDGPATAGDFVCDLVERIADLINDTVDDIDGELDQYESVGNVGVKQQYHQILARIRRQSASIRRYLAPQRDALDALYRIRGILNDHQAYSLREQSERMTRYIEELDLARERAMVLQEEQRNRVAEAQGMRMYVLSIVTAIFLPLSFLTGVFGMNVAGLPGLENPSAFNNLASSMLGLAVVLLLVMIWKKWL
ncbi:zinc transporter ZntB [Alteromonadaceae bacterium BrNp21-10]|nr:zinc transporter ZntB [Alteromonadaceae bacterium BrNp21-10]